MQAMLIMIALLIGGLSAPSGPASAADGKPATPHWHYSASGHDLPFSRSERAQAVWASGACWSECGAFCAWGWPAAWNATRKAAVYG